MKFRIQVVRVADDGAERMKEVLEFVLRVWEGVNPQDEERCKRRDCRKSRKRLQSTAAAKFSFDDRMRSSKRDRKLPLCIRLILGLDYRLIETSNTSVLFRPF